MMSQDARIIGTLLFADTNVSENVEATLSKVLDEVPDISLSSSDELLDTVLRFESRVVFPSFTSWLCKRDCVIRCRRCG